MEQIQLSGNQLMLRSQINARQKVVEQFWMKYYRLKLKSDPKLHLPSGDETDKFINMLNDLSEMEEAHQASVQAFMITLNPPDDTYDWKYLQKVVEQILEKKNFLGDLYVTYEQRSEDVKNPHGWHCHILGYNLHGRCKSDVCKRIHQSMRKVAKELELDTPAIQSVDVKEKKTEKSVSNALSYIKGEKSKNSGCGPKEQKIEVDKYHREMQKLDDYYEYVLEDSEEENTEVD